MIEKKYLELLKVFNTDNNSHTNRTLTNHLIGTYELLEKWGNSKEICLAGLFHSIYGTMFYKIPSVELSEREYLKKNIGTKSEELSYLFCITDRRKYFDLIDENKVELIDVVHNKNISISKIDLFLLIEIEFANILEQIEHLDVEKVWLLGLKNKIESVNNDVSSECYKDITGYLKSKLTN